MSEFFTAIEAIQAPGTDVRGIARPILRALPVSGAAVSTFGRLLPMETISATDDRARRVDELQFDLREGPCWDAVADGLPVIEADLRRPGRRWPAFSPALEELAIGGIAAYPLIFGTLRLGALDLYSDLPLEWTPRTGREASSIASAVARTVLKNALAHVEPDGGAESPHSRRLIHQATGMVIAQLRVSAEDAELLIRGHAFAVEVPMREVAERIIARTLEFRRGENGIEAIS